MSGQAPPRAAIYCRLSREDEGRERESESIRNQKAMLTEYAAAMGWQVCGVYCDEDYSGADRERPAFNQMLEAARRGCFDVILAKSQSRFTRDMELTERYLHGLFAQWGVRFIAPLDHVDTGDAAGKKSRQLNGLINEWYLEDLSENVRAVLTHKRRRGQYIGAFALYGYQKDPADKNRLTPDPEAAALVRRVFALYLSGLGAARIARLLNSEGVPSPTEYKRRAGLAYGQWRRGPGAALWGRATVCQMLKNETYKGDLVQGRHKKLGYKSKKTVWLPRESWICVPGTHPGLVSREDFDRVQAMLAQKARGGSGGRVHPLAGKVKCGLCGGGMEQTGNSRGRRYFRCRLAGRSSLCPGQGYAPAAELEALAAARLKEHAAGWLAGRPWEKFSSSSAPAGGQKREQAAKARQELARLQRGREQLYLDKCTGLLSGEEFARMNESFREKEEALKETLAAAEEAAAPQQSPALQARQLAEWQTLPRELVSLVLEEIRIYPKEENGSRRVEFRWLF